MRNTCGAGYRSQAGATACEACPAGTYSGVNATAACTDCPAGFYSESTAATAVATCLACPPGMDCAKFANLESALLEDGWWRTGERSSIVVKCVHGVKACKSGAPPAERRLLIGDGSQAAHDARTLTATSFVVGAGFASAAETA